LIDLIIVAMTGSNNRYSETRIKIFLELGIAGQAQCVMTGDRDLFVLNLFREIPVVIVERFLAEY
jgi:predicted nucleic acid-binding protein